MNRLKNSTTACVTLALALATPLWAAEKSEKGAKGEKSGSAEKGSSEVAAMDKAWAHVAAVSDKMELELAKVASTKGESAEVKQHAQQMTQDHGKRTQELKQWATTNKVDLHAELPPEKQAVVKEISSKSGAEFDKAYLEHEVAHHRMAAAHFQNGTEFLANPELKQFAQTNQPTINQHLAMVESATGHQGRAGNTAGAAGQSRGSGGSAAGASGAGSAGSTAGAAGSTSGATGATQSGSGRAGGSSGTVGTGSGSDAGRSGGTAAGGAGSAGAPASGSATRGAAGTGTTGTGTTGSGATGTGAAGTGSTGGAVRVR